MENDALQYSPQDVLKLLEELHRQKIALSFKWVAELQGDYDHREPEETNEALRELDRSIELIDKVIDGCCAAHGITRPDSANR